LSFVSFFAKAISARSLAISSVAEGLAAANAAAFIDSILSGEFNQEQTVSAMTLGSPEYFPNPEFSTKGTFPSSWPGLQSIEKKHRLDASNSSRDKF
jgi:hypothetical protein